MKIYSNEMIKNKIDKQKKIKKILKYILYPIALFIIICAIDIIYQKTIKKENDVSLFGFRTYIVLTGSMEPELQVGDVVISKKVNKEDIKIGDIITFKGENDATITHRVTNIIIDNGKRLYQTKGDNNNAKDVGLISNEDIMGKCILKISGAGKFVKKIITPTGLIVLTLIITILYINISKYNDRKIARHLIRERYKKQNPN